LDVAFEEFMKLRYEFYRAFTTYSERLPIKPITCACLAAVPERYVLGVLQKIIAWAFKLHAAEFGTTTNAQQTQTR
jgi:hypothetical protein